MNLFHGCFASESLNFLAVTSPPSPAIVTAVAAPLQHRLSLVPSEAKGACPAPNQPCHSPEAFEAVRDALVKAGITPTSAELAMVPQNFIKLTGTQAAQMVRLIKTLEEHDDVQHVHSNFDVGEK